MIAIDNFLLAFAFSFIGSVPPGTINLTVIQLGLENKLRTALRFSLAASVIEYPYAWIAVKFEKLITASPVITENITLISAIVMVVIGGLSLIPARTSPAAVRFSNSGYRRGLLIGILNPLAIPYWIAMTAYLGSLGWIRLDSHLRIHSYLLGVFLGAFALLVVLSYLAKRVNTGFASHPWIRRIPAIVLLSLGLYSLSWYLFNNSL